MFEPKNMVLICADCNEIKGSLIVTKKNDIKRYPRSSAAFKIVHPHFDKYEEYIHITKEGHFVGKDDLGKRKGSQTILLYGLNRTLDKLKFTNNGNVDNDFFAMARRMAEGKSLEEKSLLLADISKVLFE